MAPPPPPPPPPPPVPGALKVPKTAQPAKKCSTSLNASKKPTDIDALLSEIRGGTRLKRVTQVNDRSAPIVPGNSSSSPKADAGPVTPSMVKSGTGGLNIAMALKQAQQSGKPLLRKTSINTIVKSPPASHTAQSTTPHSIRSDPFALTKSSSPYSTNDPPTLSSVSSSSSLNVSNSVRRTTNPTLIPKPSVAVKPSIERPTVKPPPLPQKPPGINRRQSFDSGQLSDLRKPVDYSSNIPSDSSRVTTHNYSSATLKPAGNKPAPPPRTTNSRSPSTLASGSSNYNSQTLRPAPRPPINTGSGTGSIKCKSVQNLTSGLAPAPSRPMKPQCPPPPPPIKAPLLPVSPSIAAPSAVNSTINRSFGQLSANPIDSSPNVAPVPPMRITSVPSNQATFGTTNSKVTLESRFVQTFRSINQMPVPEPFTKVKKQYPGGNQSKRKNQAPHPPAQITDGLHPYKSNTALLNV